MLQCNGRRERFILDEFMKENSVKLWVVPFIYRRESIDRLVEIVLITRKFQKDKK